MSIDWQKAEENPNKKLKIEGQTLLNIRNENERLEKQLAQTQNQQFETEKKLISITKELEQTQRSLQVKEKIVEDLNQQVNELNQRLKLYTTKVKDLEMQLTQATMSSEKLEEEVAQYKLNLEDANAKIKLKDAQISEFNLRLQNSNESIRELTTKTQTLSTQLSEMAKEKSSENLELTRIKEQLERAINQINQKKTKISELNSKFEGTKDLLKGTIPVQQTGAIKEKPVLKEQTTFRRPSARKEEEPIKERIACPKCGAVGKDIKTMEDRTKVISYMGQSRIYAKKRVCKKCGTEF